MNNKLIEYMKSMNDLKSELKEMKGKNEMQLNDKDKEILALKENQKDLKQQIGHLE